MKSNLNILLIPLVLSLDEHVLEIHTCSHDILSNALLFFLGGFTLDFQTSCVSFDLEFD